MASEQEIVDAFRRGDKRRAVALLSTVRVHPSTIRDLVDNWTLLHHAASSDNWLDVCKLLVDKYQLDPHFTDRHGWTALHYACMYNRHEVVRYLVRYCCSNPLAKSNGGDTPLDLGSGESRKFLQEIIDTSRKQGFVNVHSYLKHKKAEAMSEEFVEAVSEGSGELAQLNVLLQGAPASGKTSLKRVIMGQPPLPKNEQNSTDIMENAVRAVSMDRVTGSDLNGEGFKEITDEEFLSLLAETTKDLMNKQGNQQQVVETSSHVPDTSSTTAKLKETATQNTASAAGSLATDGPTHAPTSASSSSTIEVSALKKDQVLEKIRENLEKVQPSSKMFNSKWHHLIDCGGQPQFQDIFPLLYRGPSLQLVVMRLTERLDDRPEWCYTVQGQNAAQSKHLLRLTNLQYIEKMCQIAASSNPQSHVMIVGTHKDKLGDNSEAVIAELNKGLEDTHEKYADVLICKDADNDDIIFDINTMATGEEREEYTKELQETIEEVNSLVNDKSQIVPLKWFALHLSISNKSGLVDRKEYREKGQVLGMNDSAIEHALKYLNGAALLLYYEEVPELVLTKVDPLVNKLSGVVKASFPLKKQRVPDKRLVCLRNKGIFDESYLNELVQKMPNLSSSLSNDVFLRLLCCLKVAVKLATTDQGQEYFLPSVLSLTRSPESLKKLSEVFKPVSAFGFHLDGCAVEESNYILPHGFFFTAIIELLSHQQSTANRDHHQDELKFALYTKKNVDQCSDEILFQEISGVIPNGLVMVVNKVNWIEVSTMCNDSRYYSAIYKSINAAIQRAMKHFPSMNELSLKDVYLCLACENCTDHYCTLTPDNRYVNCSVNPGRSIATPNKIRRWIDPSATHSSSVVVSKAFEFLQNKSADWDGIARAFGLDLNFRKGLRQNVMLDDNSRLETVLSKWIESAPIQPATWFEFMGILSSESLQYNDVAHRVQTYLDTLK